MSHRTAPARTRSPRPHDARLRRDLPAAPRGRGVAVFVEVPDGEGFPDAGELLDLAGALYEIAQDLVPGATTRTEVRLGDAGAPVPPDGA